MLYRLLGCYILICTRDQQSNYKKQPSLHTSLSYSKCLYHCPSHGFVVSALQVHVYAGKPVLTRPEKERKIQLCISVLETLGKVDPGYTKWRGTLLQELIHPLMLISKVNKPFDNH